MAEEDGVKTPRTNYQGNSQKAKEGSKEPEQERPRAEAVTKGVVRKKPLSKKIAETFTGDDAHSVGSYLLFDVVIPATKNLISDMVRQGIDRLLFGEVGGKRTAMYRPGSTNYTAYNKMSSGATRSDLDRPNAGGRISDRGRRTHDFTEVLIPDRGEAEFVLDRLTDLVDTFGAARVSDFYDLVEITGDYTDDKYGWVEEEIRSTQVRQVRGGYILDFPRPMPLN